MTEAPSPKLSPEARTLGSTLVALTPLLAMLAGAGAFAAAGSDDLVAAALALEPAQAPGYPLATLLARAFAWLPLGPLPLRVALSSAAALALAAAALYRTLETSAAGEDGGHPLVRSPLAIGVLLFAFGCDLLFAGDARAYAPSVALACLYLERLAAMHAAWPRLQLRALRGAAFWLALLCAEQPALALALLIGSFAPLRRLLRAYRLPAAQALMLGGGVPLALGLFALAARAGVHGACQSWLGAFELAAHPTPLEQRFATLVLGPSLLLCGALLALLRYVRKPAQRRALGPWLGVTSATVAAGLLLAHAAAAFAVALCAAAALSALSLSGLLAGAARDRLALAVALCALLLGLSHLRASALRATARDARTWDVLREPELRALPARSLLLLEPSGAHALRAAALEERVRPDVHVAPKPWQLDLAASQALARSLPELQPLLRATQLQRELPLTELQTLAARRPLLVELEPSRERALYEGLLPWGLYHQVSTSAISRSDERFAAHDADARLQALDSLLETEPSTHPDSDLYMAARARADADYYAHAGDSEHAAQATARAHVLAPDVAR